MNRSTTAKHFMFILDFRSSYILLDKSKQSVHSYIRAQSCRSNCHFAILTHFRINVQFWNRLTNVCATYSVSIEIRSEMQVYRSKSWFLLNIQGLDNSRDFVGKRIAAYSCFVRLYLAPTVCLTLERQMCVKLQLFDCTLPSSAW